MYRLCSFVCNNRGQVSTGNPKGRLLVPSFSLVVPRVPCLREEELYMADKSEIDQKLAEAGWEPDGTFSERSEEHTSELQSRQYLVCRLLLEKKKQSSHHRE